MSSDPKDTRIAELEARARKAENYLALSPLAARVAVLEKVLRDVFDLIEEGFLVRDTSKDSDPRWAVYLLHRLIRLRDARDALTPSEETEK